LLLLTDPTHFEVTYTINPWMEPYIWAENPVGHRTAARRSFQSLAATLTAAGARLEIMPGIAGLPDMVFPANAAVVLDRLALLGRFRHPERGGEEKHFQEHFRVLMERRFLDEVAPYCYFCYSFSGFTSLSSFRDIEFRMAAHFTFCSLATSSVARLRARDGNVERNEH
jgi:hypothetical protein